MIVLARAKKGQEFIYSAASAHKVPKSSAEKIRDALNNAQYGITPEQVWFLFEVGPYDNAYAYAEYQSFGIRKGRIYERSF